MKHFLEASSLPIHWPAECTRTQLALFVAATQKIQQSNFPSSSVVLQVAKASSSPLPTTALMMMSPKAKDHTWFDHFHQGIDSI